MKPVEIYVKENCPWCARARQLLMSRGALFTEKDITYAPELKEEMIRRTGGRDTTPQIFIGGEYIGDYEALKRLDETGELPRKLSYTGNPDDIRTTHV